MISEYPACGAQCGMGGTCKCNLGANLTCGDCDKDDITGPFCNTQGIHIMIKLQKINPFIDQCKNSTFCDAGDCTQDFGYNFTCSSPGKRILDNNVIYIIANINKGVGACESNPCGVNATCKIDGDSFSCTCREGFHGNGTNCTGMVALQRYERELRRELTTICLTLSTKFVISLPETTVVSCDGGGNGGCDFHTKCAIVNNIVVCGSCPEGFLGTGYDGCQRMSPSYCFPCPR
jgi:hypothetical protein